LVRYLGDHGYRVSAAESAAAFRRQLENSAPDLLVLDIMMPGDDGLTLCRELRAKSQIPIIFLTAMIEDTDRIVGLEMGADDYVTKPFNPRELLARIKAVMRRTQSLPPTRTAVRAERIHFEDKVLDVGRREVVGPDSVAVPLSNTEFRLLCVFLERPGVVLSRDQLLDLTSGRPADVWDRGIDNQVSRLRRKIEKDPAQPALIKTCWGDGYQFVGKVRKS
jgi:two-component system, OmpR family, response regulator